MRLGNGHWESTAFNSRLQPTQIALGVTPGATNLLKLDYVYGATAAVNNGNITKQTISVLTVGQTPGFTAVQDYTYDSLNRLKSAVENLTPNGGSQSMTWQQAFEFDRYGNRNFDEANTNFTGFDKLCERCSALCEELRKVLNPDVNQSDNRLSSSDGYVFDDAGNTTRDPRLRKFTYDAENKQVKVESVDSGGTVTGTIGEYVYDGDGKRIKKIVPMAIAPFNDEVTVFVYDAAGKLVAEYASVTSQDPKVSYTTADHLGSPRMLTDENGDTISRRDFHPFGEEILTTHRHPDLGYTPDDVRQKFTTYERDGETDLDFAQARYSSAVKGRFLSADRYFLLDRKLNYSVFEASYAEFLRFVVQPQYFNRYVYTVNNPLKFIDVEGLHPGAAVVVGALAKQAAIGAGVGAIVGAAIETGRQIYTHGEIESKDDILRAAGAGAIYGAFVGVAGPVGKELGRPLAARVLLGGAGSNAAGSGTRYLAGERTTTGDVLTDTMAGAVGGGVGYGVSRLPVLPRRVYIPSNPVTRTAARVSITKVDSQRGIWWSPYNAFGDSVVGNAARSGTKSAINKAKGKEKEKKSEEAFRTEVVGYELFLEY